MKHSEKIQGMQNRWSTLVNKATDVASKSSNKLADIVTKQTHRFTLTGLSRSGKSMLFTSILTMLKSRNDDGYVCLPLLRTLPPENIVFTRIEPLEGFKPFPLTLSLEALANQEWPESELVYAKSFPRKIGCLETSRSCRQLVY